MKTATAKKLKPVPELLKLDLGAGQHCKEGFEGVDIVKLPGIKYVHDLKKYPWPWKSDSVSETFCSHFLEHLTGPERVTFMDELYRILVPEGKAVFIAPYWSSMRAVQDPTHAWPPLCEASFLYFNAKWRKDNGLDHYKITSDFDFVFGYGINPVWMTRNDETRQFAIANYCNSVQDLHCTLTSRKGMPPAPPAPKAV